MFFQSQINILNSTFGVQINVDQLTFWPNESPFSKGDELKSIYKFEMNWHHLYTATQDHTVPTITLSSLIFCFAFIKLSFLRWNMLPPFSNISGSAPFSKGHVSFLALFFKGFRKCFLSRFGAIFQRFSEVPPFPSVMSIFPRSWSMCAQVFPFSKVCFLLVFQNSLFQGLPVFLQCFVPFPKVAL